MSEIKCYIIKAQRERNTKPKTSQSEVKDMPKPRQPIRIANGSFACLTFGVQFIAWQC